MGTWLVKRCCTLFPIISSPLYHHLSYIYLPLIILPPFFSSNLSLFLSFSFHFFSSLLLSSLFISSLLFSFFSSLVSSSLLPLFFSNPVLLFFFCLFAYYFTSFASFGWFNLLSLLLLLLLLLHPLHLPDTIFFPLPLLLILNLLFLFTVLILIILLSPLFTSPRHFLFTHQYVRRISCFDL